MGLLLRENHLDELAFVSVCKISRRTDFKLTGGFTFADESEKQYVLDIYS